MAQTLDNMSYTWNNGSTVFTGIKYNVTDVTSSASSLLMDLQVNGVSKFSIDKSGKAGGAARFGIGADVGGTSSSDGNHAWISIGGAYVSYLHSSVALQIRASSIQFYSGSDAIYLPKTGFTIDGLYTQNNPTIRNFDFSCSVPDYVDCPTRNFRIIAGAPRSTNTTNITGGNITLQGGAGASASAGAAHGGNLYLRGGAGYGTGHIGYIVMDNLPTTNPAVIGALWNNAGILAISAG